MLDCVAVYGAAAGVGGFIPLDRDAHPPCDQLPRFTEATAALATHAGLAAEIERLGERVAVGAGQPCPGDASRGLVVVTYGSRAERDAVRDLLGRRDGFGVPVHLVRH